MKRTFRHEAEGRTWWIEVHESTLRIGFSDDSEPGEEVVRERRASTPKAAQDELAALIREQLAEGFAETGVAPSETTEAFFSRLHQAWKSAAPHIPSEVWLHELQALPVGFRTRLHHEWPNTYHRPNVPSPQAYQEQSWLRMQVEVTSAPYLLGLRDPAATPFILHTLARAPSDTPHLETALLSLIESPVPLPAPLESFMPGHTTTMIGFPFSPESIARLIELAHAKDADRASNAALLLGCSMHISPSRADVAGALLAWLALGDDVSIHVSRLIDHAVPTLGHTFHRDLNRPRTRAELTRLLARALPPTT